MNVDIKQDMVNSTNILSINHLMENKKNDFSDVKYSVQNKVFETFSSSITYGLYCKINNMNIISKLMYVGNNYFITILTNDMFNSISRFSTNYYVLNINERLTISSLVGYPNNIENNFTICLIQLDSNSEACFEFNIITPDMYLEIEQKNNEISYEVNNLIVSNFISNINENYITTVDGKNNLTLGTPVFMNNTLIGIYYRKSGSICNFYRLSSIYNWLNKYDLINKNKSIMTPTYIPYTNEQLYQIILSLNNRILELENNLKIQNN